MRGGGFREFEQFLKRHFAAFLDDIPDLALAFGEFRQFTGERQRADKQPLAPAGFFLADRFGQDAFQGDFGRAAIIFANPARELEDLGRDERLRADDFEDGLEIRMRGFLGERRDATEHFARAERHLHAAADVHLSFEPGRNRIIELLAERDFKGDAGDHGAGRIAGISEGVNISGGT